MKTGEPFEPAMGRIKSWLLSAALHAALLIGGAVAMVLERPYAQSTGGGKGLSCAIWEEAPRLKADPPAADRRQYPAAPDTVDLPESMGFPNSSQGDEPDLSVYNMNFHRCIEDHGDDWCADCTAWITSVNDPDWRLVWVTTRVELDGSHTGNFFLWSRDRFASLLAAAVRRVR